MKTNELARMELQWRGKADDPPMGKFGDYLGRADGKISGPAINGTVMWDLFEIPGEKTCEANFQGTIETADGAAINFEILGFFSRNADDGNWRLASAIRFKTDAEQYLHLDNGLGWIAGIFDMATYRHDYEIVMPEIAGVNQLSATVGPTQ